jgi:hypothetical protein
MTAILLVGLTLVLAAVYFLPAIIAVRHRCRWDAAIFVFNLLLGWTVFGWFGALSWALGGGFVGGRLRSSHIRASSSGRRTRNDQDRDHPSRLRRHRGNPALGSVSFENAFNERGERYVWLPPNVVDRLKAHR